ncbi:MAG TPA: hypothetical protein VFN55_03325 [Solirubrobacteraceae bacterium]|nr:hypothetical protein [Solirubrobacteraceae bacterium]
MSARFLTNFVVLLVGAGIVVVGFAFSLATLDWAAVGAGAVAVVAALANFAARHQGVYQRTADLAIGAVGAWLIVAARVLDDHSRWLELSAGLALAALGAIGLIVREVRLHRGLWLGEIQIGADRFARIAAVQRSDGDGR